MALATPLANQAMGLGPSSMATRPRSNSVLSSQPAGTTADSQMAGDRTTMPDASGGRSVGNWLTNAMKNLGKPSQTPVSPNPGLFLKGGISNAVNVVGQAAAPVQGANQAGNALAYYQAMYGPQLAQLAQQATDLMNQKGLSDAQYKLDKGYAYTQNQNSSALLGNQEYRDVGLTRDDIAAQEAYLNNLHDVNANQFGADQSYYDKQRALVSRGLESDRQYRQDVIGTGMQTRSLQDLLAQQAYGMQFRNAMGDSSARGATGSSATANTATDLSNQLSGAKESNYLSFKGLADTANKRLSDAGQQADAANAGLFHGWETTMNNYTQTQAQEQNARAQLKTKNAYLDSLASDYGIQRDQLQAALENSMAKMGLDYESTIAKLASASQSNVASDVATQQAIIQSAIANASNFPTTRTTMPTAAPTPASVPRIRRV